MPELIAPTSRLHRAWLDAQAEWGPGLHEDGFGLFRPATSTRTRDSLPGRPACPVFRIGRPADGSSRTATCWRKPGGIGLNRVLLVGATNNLASARTIERLGGVGPAPARRPLLPLPAGEVHSTFWWIVEGDRYLGGIDLRHYLNAVLLEGGGNIGYSIRASARGNGLASWALGQVLLRAGSFGLDRVLLVCHEDNHASARTIERNGGVLEDVRGTGGAAKRRYWRTVRQ